MPKRNRTDASPRGQSVQAAFDRFTVKVLMIVVMTTAVSVISMGPAEAVHRITDSLYNVASFFSDLPGAY